MKKEIDNKHSKVFTFKNGKIMCLNALSFAALAGLVAIGTPAMANDSVLGDEASLKLLKNKSVETSTLNFLQKNNISISQKVFKLDSYGNIMKENGKPVYDEPVTINAPSSAYKIVVGSKEEHVFEYKTADKDGNITLKYYNIELTNNKGNGNFLKLGKSKNIVWKELAEEPAQGTENVVSVKLPNDVTKYYKYTLKKDYSPSNYTKAYDSNNGTVEIVSINSSRYSMGGVIKVKEGETVTIKDTLFINNKTEAPQGLTFYGGVLSNGSTVEEIIADFIGNSAVEGKGGAIASFGSNATIGDITGDFIGNSVDSAGTSSSIGGGAIYNYGNATIGNISGDFVGNSANNFGGGAILNYGMTKIGNITGDFIGNTVVSEITGSSGGGAILNSGSAKIANITGDFIGNTVTVKGQYSGGGAIYNYGNSKIGDINGNFIANTVDANASFSGGGAVYNYGSSTIASITGDFISNSTNGYGGGGAIYNCGNATIGYITGDFIGNTVVSEIIGDTGGGAIYNYSNSTIGDITGNFIGNTAVRGGGAIYNYGNATIGNIIGDFINNTANTGGAIYNYSNAIIGNIIGDFINNTANGHYGYGGAIYNCFYSTIGDITGDFIGNTANNDGGAIYNQNNSTIGNITGDFIGNTANNDGGAIYNYGNSTIGNITGDFIGNISYKGGAIYNTDHSTIGNISGNFINNTANGLYGFGGAIYNYNGSKIGDITGDFIGNSATQGYGGAIYNYNGSKIGDITGDFIGNNVNYHGGAIYNQSGGIIGNITGDFIDNRAASNCGGAIYNDGNSTIGDITGNFIKNTANDADGGAIFNSSGSTIGDITGNFIGNTAKSTGGAIFNTYGSKIGNIKGNFIGNAAEVTYDGGAIANTNGSTIGDITGDFIGNAGGIYGGAGGAIYNCNGSKIGDITGDFIANKGVSGGAIYNASGPGIGNITGNFVGNISDGNEGGAIYNASSVIENITGNFINNKGSQTLYGGAISNTSKIGNIKGDFIGNHAYKGGAIYNYQNGVIDNITGNFIGNSATIVHDSCIALGGAISTEANLNILADNETSTFKDNYVQTNEGDIDYNAIYVLNGATLNLIARNDGVINMYDNINGKTTKVAQKDGDGNNLTDAEGNIVYNDAHYTVNITGDETGTLNLYNDIKNANVVVDSVKVNLANNDIHNYELYNLTSDASAKYVLDVDIVNGTADTITTESKSNGTVTIDSLRLSGELTSLPEETQKIQVLFTQNDDLQLALSKNAAEEEYKIGVGVKDVLEEIKAETSWDYKYSVFEQELDVYGKMELATTTTTNDSIGISVSRTDERKSVFKEVQGDTLALWNGLDTNEVKNFNFSSEKNVYVVAKDSPETLGLGETKGSELNVNGVISQDGERSSINFNSRKGFELNAPTNLNIKNVTLTKAHGDNGSVIKVTDSNSTVNLTNVNLIKNTSTDKGAAIYSNSNVNITADGAVSVISKNYSNGKDEAVYLADSDKTLTLKTINNGKIVLDDSVNGEKGYNVSITGDKTGTVVLNNDIYNANLTLGNTNFNTINNSVHTYNFESLTLNGNVNAALDVDLARCSMDRFAAGSYGKHQGYFNVTGINMLSEAKENVTNIFFADKGFKDNVTTSVKEYAYAPIYKYAISYDNREDGGYFVFSRGGAGSGNSSDDFNPAILSAPVSGVAASKATINETFKYAFEHADSFTKMPAMERMTKINANKYAMSTTFNSNLCKLCDDSNKAVWFRPYATFESMNLKNGPTVDAITYGSLTGFDTDFFEHKRGWHSVGSGYIGYNGSQLSYKGSDTTMNGGLLGYTHTMYKGNFWSALTFTAGASVGESHTMYGKENYTSLMAGVGSKTGYNLEFKDGKFILQPMLFMSYTFVNTFDYKNAAGVKISASPAHSIQLNPAVRFVANTKRGWQPYASVGVVWNVMNKNEVTADSVRLPEMGMKPYVEYGVGLQRTWKEKFTAFTQAMIRNGGRNGIALTAGFSWAIGRDGSEHKHEKVQTPSKDRKVMKQLSPQRKMALNGEKNSTITSNKAVIKHL